MKTVKDGDNVQILCEVTLDNGKFCFGTEKGNPIDLVVGEGNMFPAIENALKEMKKGEKKTVILEPKETFGPHRRELVIGVSKNIFKSDAHLSIDSKVKIDGPSKKAYYATITDIKEDTLTLDLNHPLAGKRLAFTITIISIK